jgi:hypothetical protein
MKPTNDFTHLLHPQESSYHPFQYVWVFDPTDHKVSIEDSSPKDAKEFPLHEHMLSELKHPDREHGYAIRIKNGWRIIDEELREVDPYVMKRVLEALNHEEPTPPLPHTRYHGDPRSKDAHR